MSMEHSSLITIFFTGLFVGGLTCMAVQGGLLAATIAQREQERLRIEAAKSGNVLPTLSFLVAKIIAYTFLGMLLGWFGSFFQLSIQAKIVLQSAVAIFMIGTALNLLNAHPVFRYFVIVPPRFITRFIRKESKSRNVFAPALLGALTVFIPCGTTQAMMALSIASGSLLLGAAILFVFTLGTAPVFFLLAYFATRLGGIFQQYFLRTAAYAIIILALFNINNVLALSGSEVTAETITSNMYCALAICDNSPLVRGAVSSAPVNTATIMIEQNQYSPNTIVVKAGSEVTLNLINKSGGGCTQAFTIPKLGIQKIVPLGSSDTVSFTAPGEPGKLSFMCSMGMYRGTIEVI